MAKRYVTQYKIMLTSSALGMRSDNPASAETHLEVSKRKAELRKLLTEKIPAEEEAVVRQLAEAAKIERNENGGTHWDQWTFLDGHKAYICWANQMRGLIKNVGKKMFAEGGGIWGKTSFKDNTGYTPYRWSGVVDEHIHVRSMDSSEPSIIEIHLPEGEHVMALMGRHYVERSIHGEVMGKPFHSIQKSEELPAGCWFTFEVVTTIKGLADYHKEIFGTINDGETRLFQWRNNDQYGRAKIGIIKEYEEEANRAVPVWTE